MDQALVPPIEVLLAEDNDDDILMIRTAFARSKLINVLNVVKDGEEALAYLRRQGRYVDTHPPGLVLLDLNMPKKNGFEVLQELKADPAIRHLPVVILTTSRQEEDVVRSYADGAASFIIKPEGLGALQTLTERFELYWARVARVPHPIER